MDADVFYDDDVLDDDLLQAVYNGELDPDLAAELLGYRGEEPYEQERLPVWELLRQCIMPTWAQTIQSILPLLTMCLIFKLISALLLHRNVESNSELTNEEEDGIPLFTLHITCAVFGLSVLHLFFEYTLFYLVVFDAWCFILLVFTRWKLRGYSGVIISVFTVIFLLTCELYLADPTQWHKIRGPLMILAMKLISLSFDLDNGIVVGMPDLWTFIGYSFHVGTVIFGPWLSFRDYRKSMSEQEFSVGWFRRTVTSLIGAMVCVVTSTCLVHWLILDNTWRWLEAYRDAQSFRFSHYFVSLISEVSMILSGAGISMRSGEKSWEFSVVRPYYIEVPRSMVDVVTNWNLPMHYWLRTYVFKPAKPFGNFIAILLTYAASSLLHGLNFQLAAVLFSLGFYTYVEFVLRNKLSRIFNACIEAKTCKDNCEHEFKWAHPYVIVTNLAFSAISIFHLAYLGLMFDSSSQEETGYTMEHTLSKWANLSYASHWFALGTFIFHVLI